MVPRTGGPGSSNPSIQGPVVSVEEGACGPPCGGPGPLIMAGREPLCGGLCGEQAGPQLRGSIASTPFRERRAEEEGAGQKARPSPRVELALACLVILDGRQASGSDDWMGSGTALPGQL